MLATATIAAVVWCVVRGRSTRDLWVVLSVALVFWGLQALVSDRLGRLPDDSRYMYPGAVFCVLILGAACQGLKWRKSAIVGLYLLGAIGLINNAALLVRNGDFYRDQAKVYKAYAGASTIVAGILAARAGIATRPPADPWLLIRDPRSALFLMIDIPYGTFSSTPQEMLRASEETRRAIDGAIASASGVKRAQTEGPVRGACIQVEGDGDGTVAGEIPAGRSVVSSRSGLDQLLIGRFADVPSVPLGPLRPGDLALVTIPADGAGVPWKVGGAGTDLEVCRQP